MKKREILYSLAKNQSEPTIYMPTVMWLNSICEEGTQNNPHTTQHNEKYLNDLFVYSKSYLKKRVFVFLEEQNRNDALILA